MQSDSPLPLAGEAPGVRAASLSVRRPSPSTSSAIGRGNNLILASALVHTFACNGLKGEEESGRLAALRGSVRSRRQTGHLDPG
jgi:hypothetical protein